MKFCTKIHLTGLFHIYSVFFWKYEKFPHFLKIFFCWLFFRNIIIFKVLKIRDSSLIETFNLNPLLKTNLFYLLNCLRNRISRKPLFLTKNGKTWRHSDVIYGQHIKPSEYFFCQDVSNWWLGGFWKFGDDPYVTSGDIAKEREGGGAKKSPPRSVAG